MSANTYTGRPAYDFTVRIPGDFDGTTWVVDGRVIDPHARANGDYSELEVVGVCLHAFGKTLEIPVRTLPDTVLRFFNNELTGRYQDEQDVIDTDALYEVRREYNA